MTSSRRPPCCPPKSPLARRRSLPPELVETLEGIYQVLASGTRIRILHALCRERELPVQEIAGRLGMKVAAVSNQLRLMSALGVLSSRAEGNRVIYTTADPCVAELLDQGFCLAVDSEKRSRTR